MYTLGSNSLWKDETYLCLSNEIIVPTHFMLIKS